MTPLAGCRAGLVALALSTPWPAAAQLPDQVHIAWDDAAACSRPASLAADVVRMLGSPAAGIAAISFDVKVARVSERAYALTLTVDDARRRAERRVQLVSCAEVQEAAALLIATAIDPAAVLRVQEQEQEAATPSPAAPAAQPIESEGPQAAAATLGRGRYDSRWSLSLGAVGDWRSLPGPSGGPQVGLALSLQSLKISTHARYLLARSSEEELTDIVSTLDLFAGAIGVSYLWSLGIFSLGPSAEVEFGVLRASSQVGDDDRDPSRRYRHWGNTLLGAGLGVMASPRVSFELGLFAGLPIWRWKLAVNGLMRPTFYETRAIHGRATLAIRVSFGSKD